MGLWRAVTGPTQVVRLDPQSARHSGCLSWAQVENDRYVKFSPVTNEGLTLAGRGSEMPRGNSSRKPSDCRDEH